MGMSQQGAEDWWQKLYEDPDAVPEPDPGDTLDQRYHSASVLVTDPPPDQAPNTVPPPRPAPGGPGCPLPRRRPQPPAPRRNRPNGPCRRPQRRARIRAPRRARRPHPLTRA